MNLPPLPDLLALAREAQLDEAHVAFVTAFMDRGKAPFTKLLGSLAWNSFVWFASEPDSLVALIGGEGAGVKLHELLRSLATRPQ
jgi:BsuBI/PstI restriction endonuclease domain